MEPGKEAPARPTRPFFSAILTFRAGTLLARAGPHRPPWAYMSTGKPLPASKARLLKKKITIFLALYPSLHVFVVPSCLTGEGASKRLKENAGFKTRRFSAQKFVVAAPKLGRSGVGIDSRSFHRSCLTFADKNHGKNILRFKLESGDETGRKQITALSCKSLFSI